MVCLYIVHLMYTIYATKHLAGSRYMSANIHSLLHLANSVRNLGPLWVHSCFPFESMNGNILKNFHGSQGVEKQVNSLIIMCASSRLGLYVYTCVYVQPYNHLIVCVYL